MSISRRDLLEQVCLFSAAATVSALVPAKLQAVVPLRTGLNEQTFSSLIKSDFKISGGKLPSPVLLTLDHVQTIQSPRQSSRECRGFILGFSGGPNEQMPQDIYTLTSGTKSALAPFNLLLVPSPDRTYHATFYSLI
jgi:hypothetical protein